MDGGLSVRITAGIRIGWWKPTGEWKGNPFRCEGFYYGPDLGDLIPGKKITWPLIDGELALSVGVLFRPDLGKRQRLETILIIDNYVEEMWDYDDFQKEPLAMDG